MQIVCLSDVHLTGRNPVGRRDNITVTQWKKIEYVLSWAKEHDAIIIQAGDLFHKSRDWDILLKSIDILKKYSVPFYCVFGQHDQYYYSSLKNNATTMGILDTMRLITLLRNNRPIEIEDILLWGSSWGEEVDISKVNSSKYNILVTHSPISERRIFPGHKITRPRTVLRKYKKFKLILAGDVHRFFRLRIGNQQVVNTGPMLRIEANDYNMIHKPCFVVYDTETNKCEKIIIPHKKSEEVLEKTNISHEEFVSDEKIDALAKAMKTKFGITGKFDIKKIIDLYKCSNRVKKILSEIYQNAAGR